MKAVTACGLKDIPTNAGSNTRGGIQLQKPTVTVIRMLYNTIGQRPRQIELSPRLHKKDGSEALRLLQHRGYHWRASSKVDIELSANPSYTTRDGLLSYKPMTQSDQVNGIVMTTDRASSSILMIPVLHYGNARKGRSRNKARSCAAFSRVRKRDTHLPAEQAFSDSPIPPSIFEGSSHGA
jgi:hypothetical protein